MTRALKEEWIGGERGRPKASLADVCTGYCAPLWKPHPTSKPSLAAAAARVLYTVNVIRSPLVLVIHRKDLNGNGQQRAHKVSEKSFAVKQKTNKSAVQKIKIPRISFLSSVLLSYCAIPNRFIMYKYLMV